MAFFLQLFFLLSILRVSIIIYNILCTQNDEIEKKEKTHKN